MKSILKYLVILSVLIEPAYYDKKYPTKLGNSYHKIVSSIPKQPTSFFLAKLWEYGSRMKQMNKNREKSNVMYPRVSLKELKVC